MTILSTAYNKTALITGASVGIGRDLAELFARDGHNLVLTARNQSQLEELAVKLRDQHHVEVEVIPKDLSLASAPQELFDAIAAKNIKIDFLVNNAGFGTHGPFATADLSSQLTMLQVNIVSLTHLTRLFLPPMIERKIGRIMNVASLAAYLPGPLMAVYYASKAYVLSFSEALDNELLGTGVTATAVCPGPTKTEFQKRAGINNARLFESGMLTSAAVAELGYRATMTGKRTVVTGFRNQMMALGTRLLPRKATAAITKKLNENR